MEEEIDLRPYMEVLISKWYWLVGVAVVAGVVAFVVSSMLPPSYEATALVATTHSDEVVELDPRIRSVDGEQPLKAFPEIAVSDGLLMELLPLVQELDSGVRSVEDLRGILKASAGEHPSLLRLTVTHDDPAITAGIANMWADLFVQQANQIYGNQGGEQLSFFQDQLAAAEADLTEAEDALVAFQADNRSAILGNELRALQNTQSNQLAKKEQLESVLQDIEGLLEQPALDSQFASILLQVRAFGGVQHGRTEQVIPQWQIQLDPAQPNEMSLAEQEANLEELQRVLLAQLAAVEHSFTILEPQILAVQQSKQEAEIENGRLLRNQTLAEETYTALANKVEEESITSQDVGSGVKLIGETAVPESPTAPNRKIITLLFSAAGVFLTAFLLLLKTAWMQQE